MTKIATVLSVLLALCTASAHGAVFIKDGAKIVAPERIVGARKVGKNYVGVGDILIRTGRLQIFSAIKNLWPGGVLVYRFDTAVTASQQSVFVAACNAWTSGTPVTCKKRTTEAGYVLVKTHNGDGCGPPTSCSELGYQGRPQLFNILASHWSSKQVIEHELGHAFGMIHEQSRQDRDSYIFVREQNVDPAFYYDIVALQSASPVSDYDYESIMHYPNCGGAKANNCNMSSRDLWTLEPRPCGLDKVGGDLITTLDRDGLRKAYAPNLYGLVGSGRAPACGNLVYGREVVPAGAVAQESFNKVEKRRMETCGSFIPIHWGAGQCQAINKTEISLNVRHRSFNCGFLWTGTRFIAEALCGCPVATFQASCAAGSGELRPYSSAKSAGSWRGGRVQHLNDILLRLEHDNILETAIVGQLQNFYFLNGADKRLESKFFRFRHKLYSYGTWKKSRNSAFRIDAATFNRFAIREKLRVEQT